MKITKYISKGLALLGIIGAVLVLNPADVFAVPASIPGECYNGGCHIWKALDCYTSEQTCEQTGSTMYYCITCNKVVEKWDRPALGHKRDAGHIIVMPTATTDGFLIYRCEHCNAYMGDQVLNATSIPLPQTIQTPSPSVLDPRVQNPLEAVPMYFDPNMLAVCYIPYHSIVTLNGVLINIDAIGAQPLAPFMQAPGKYVIQVTPNTNPEHAKLNMRTFTVTIPDKAGTPVTVK